MRTCCDCEEFEFSNRDSAGDPSDLDEGTSTKRVGDHICALQPGGTAGGKIVGGV